MSALVILHLLKDRKEATDIVERYRVQSVGDEAIASTNWIDANYFGAFEAELIGKYDESEAVESRLLESAGLSRHPGANGSFALWAIGLSHWAKDQQEQALRCFEQCEQKGQIEFPQHAWSRAILRRNSTKPENADRHGK